ncbi:FAD/NAD(P)-binding domain-containing protein [Jackrogersella minutella]|nr:FAD/NAD(P)-binding domain-containing protein [Jackrogersella minutella]
MAPVQKPFRVILVGGGLVSLTAAHILVKAGINFVILEQHDDLLPEIGSLLSLWPPTFRIFDQLGLLDPMQPVLNDVNLGVTMSADDGSILSQLKPKSILEKNHGHPVQVTHRPRFMEVLYQSLPDSAKAQIKLKKRVVGVNVFDDGVSVECADGTVVEGSIVIGADGVHSRVRPCMQAMAEGKPPPDKSQGSKSPYISSYRMFIGNLPIPPGVNTNTNYECASERISTQLVTGNSQAWFAVYEALDKPTSERVRYTEQDEKRFLEKLGHLYMAPGWKLRELYPLHVGYTGMINLEEGRVDKWFWKRIVLVSDAVRKLEPHAGLGYNSGLIDVVVLVNKLRRLLQTETSPSTKSLEAVFADYEMERKNNESIIHTMSIRRARQLAWLSPVNKIISKYIAPWTHLSYYSLLYIYAPLVARIPVLEWLEENSLSKTLQVPYKYHPVLNGTGIEKPSSRGYDLSTYSKAIALAALAAVGFRYYSRI